jgi:hypothetical protein
VVIAARFLPQLFEDALYMVGGLRVTHSGKAVGWTCAQVDTRPPAA